MYSGVTGLFSREGAGNAHFPHFHNNFPNFLLLSCIANDIVCVTLYIYQSIAIYEHVVLVKVAIFWFVRSGEFFFVTL